MTDQTIQHNDDRIHHPLELGLRLGLDRPKFNSFPAAVAVIRPYITAHMAEIRSKFPVDEVYDCLQPLFSGAPVHRIKMDERVLIYSSWMCYELLCNFVANIDRVLALVHIRTHHQVDNEDHEVLENKIRFPMPGLFPALNEDADEFENRFILHRWLQTPMFTDFLAWAVLLAPLVVTATAVDNTMTNENQNNRQMPERHANEDDSSGLVDMGEAAEQPVYVFRFLFSERMDACRLLWRVIQEHAVVLARGEAVQMTDADRYAVVLRLLAVHVELGHLKEHIRPVHEFADLMMSERMAALYCSKLRGMHHLLNIVHITNLNDLENTNLYLRALLKFVSSYLEEPGSITPQFAAHASNVALAVQDVVEHFHLTLPVVRYVSLNRDQLSSCAEPEMNRNRRIHLQSLAAEQVHTLLEEQPAALWDVVQYVATRRHVYMTPQLLLHNLRHGVSVNTATEQQQ